MDIPPAEQRILEKFGPYTLITGGVFWAAHTYKYSPKNLMDWMTLNGVTSVLLAMLFLFKWPASSLLLVGLYVGISLLFDGWALVAIGLILRNRTREAQ